MKNVTVTLVTHEGSDTKSAVLSGTVGDLGNDKVDQFFISNLRAVLNEIDPPTATGQNGCGIVGDNITQVYDYVAEAKRNTLHHLLIQGYDAHKPDLLVPEQVAGLVNKAYEELELPPVDKESEAWAELNNLCAAFGCPGGMRRVEWLRSQLKKLKCFEVNAGAQPSGDEAEEAPSIIDRTAVDKFNEIYDLCTEFGCPAGVGSAEWLRTQLTRLKEVTDQPSEAPLAKTYWPHRKVALVFSHPTLGDGRFMPLVLQAHAEFVGACQHDDRTKFIASNGVEIEQHHLTRPYPL